MNFSRLLTALMDILKRACHKVIKMQNIRIEGNGCAKLFSVAESSSESDESHQYSS